MKNEQTLDEAWIADVEAGHWVRDLSGVAGSKLVYAMQRRLDAMEAKQAKQAKQKADAAS
jgi:hypothetical protein